MGRCESGEICGPCSGATHLAFICQQCGEPGDIYAVGRCSMCVGTRRVRALLTDPTTGTPPPRLTPLLNALSTVSGPSLVKWAHRSATARLLAALVARNDDINHHTLDLLPQDNTTREIREILVVTGVLPAREETLAQQHIWISVFLGRLSTSQQLILRPYAEWQVLRVARRNAGKGRYHHGSSRYDRRKLSTAAHFLNWLDDRQLRLGATSQTHLDQWIDANNRNATLLAPFIAWARRRRLVSALEIDYEPRALPSQFLTDDDFHQQLQRCLNDPTIPLDARVVAALVRLYGLSVSRILTLTTDRFHRDDGHAYLTISEHPVLLPPKLAVLIERQINARAPSMFQISDGPRYLLPGRPPSRPRTQKAIGRVLSRNGLPTLAARNTAMIETAAQLPAIVISDLFGIHVNTAHQWAELARAAGPDTSPPPRTRANQATDSTVDRRLQIR
ncbi:hypothetical protein [Nocardia sp. NPDC049707]|uniref:hypothetical protein n=1 Tax=Nocardia sp. NPDC049707 TaxID=3154735 RepID=UPI0034326A90